MNQNFYFINNKYNLLPGFQVYFCSGKYFCLAVLISESKGIWKCKSDIGIVYLERGQMIVDEVIRKNNKIIYLCS